MLSIKKFNQLQLFILLLFSSFFDAITTIIVLESGGLEFNPFWFHIYNESIIIFFFIRALWLPIIFYYISSFFKKQHIFVLILFIIWNLASINNIFVFFSL